MKLIVISSPDKFNSEIKIVARMFDDGLELFHLRKPRFSMAKMEEYLDLIPARYHNRVMIHSYHQLALKYNLKGIHLTKKHKRFSLKNLWFIKWLRLRRPEIKISTSFHSLAGLLNDKRKYYYVFLSPVFDSISKKGYRAGFSDEQLLTTLKETGHRVIALGGVEAQHLDKARELGFSGVALLGAVWNSNQSETTVFNEVKNGCMNKRKPIKRFVLKPVKIAI